MPAVLSKMSTEPTWRIGEVTREDGFTVITSADFCEYDYPLSYLDGATVRETLDAGYLFIPTLTVPMLHVLQGQHFARPEVVRSRPYGLCVFIGPEVGGRPIFPIEPIRFPCSSICCAPRIMERLSRGESVRGIDMSALRALRGMGMRFVEPASPLLQPLPIPARTVLHECCICMEHPARYGWSRCAHPEPRICLRCKNRIVDTRGKRRQFPCILCRQPGNLVRHKLAR